MNPPTPQLAAWQGAFGNAYIDRNPASDAIIALRAQGFARMLAPLCGRAPNSVLEIGANIGLNLRALQRLGMGGLQAVEPNPRARATDCGSGAADLAGVRRMRRSAAERVVPAQPQPHR